MTAETTPQIRTPLTRDRIVTTAVELADNQGIGAVTMRGLASQLGVEAMSLYNHVDNKEDILDGMIDIVMTELLQAVSAHSVDDADWKSSMRQRILAARTVMVSHSWAPGVFETRTEMTPNILTYFDDLFGEFKRGGFSVDLAHHAMHALGSRALGFTQELFEPAEGQPADPEIEQMMMQQMAKQYPNIGELIGLELHQGDEIIGYCDSQFEFEFSLDLILDGLDRLRSQA